MASSLDVFFRHVRRSANGFADLLAKQGAGRSFVLMLLLLLFVSSRGLGFLYVNLHACFFFPSLIKILRYCFKKKKKQNKRQKNNTKQPIYWQRFEFHSHHSCARSLFLKISNKKINHLFHMRHIWHWVISIKVNFELLSVQGLITILRHLNFKGSPTDGFTRPA